MGFPWLKEWPLLLILFILAAPAQAAPIYGSIAAKGSYGKAFSTDQSVPSRTMLAPAIEGVLAWKTPYFILGLHGEYALWQQYAKPSSIADSNVQGSLVTITPTLGIGGGPVRLFVRYFPLFAQYDLLRPNRAGENQVYTSAKQLAAQLHLRFPRRSFLALEYAKTTFNEREANGETYALAAGAEMSFQSYGVLYGFYF